MSDNRNTQFAGFAKALWAELEANIQFIPEGETMRATFLPMIEGIIAQRAYDLVTHSFVHAREFEPLAIITNDEQMQQYIRDEAIPYVPDMPELPKEK